MERMKIGVDIPFFVWMNDLATTISYFVCFGSLITSIWLLGLGLPIHWSAPIVFGILAGLFKAGSAPYTNTKQQLENIVKENDGEENK